MTVLMMRQVNATRSVDVQKECVQRDGHGHPAEGARGREKSKMALSVDHTKRCSCFLRTSLRMAKSIAKIGEFFSTSPRMVIVRSSRAASVVFVNLASGSNGCNLDANTEVKTSMLPN